MAAALLMFGLPILRARKRTFPRGKLDRKIFWLSVGFEIVAIIAAGYLLTAAHAPSYILAAIAIIVGLHFIGMWLATGRRDYLAVCAAMCALGVAAFFLTPPLRMLLPGFGSALTLWTAAFRLSRPTV